MGIAMVAAGMGALFALWGVYIVALWRQTSRLAPEVYAAKRADGELLATVPQSEFVAAFVRSEGPRFMTYLFAGAAICIILVPALMAAFNLIWDHVWRATGQVPWFSRGDMVHTIMMVLLYFAAMVLVAAGLMFRYHAVSPPNLRQITRSLNGDAP